MASTLAMRVIGVCGGIAVGKSTLARIALELGADQYINADLYGHRAYAKGTPCFQDLLGTFGEEIIDRSSGEINRRALGAIVFADEGKLEQLNALVWPAIRTQIETELAGWRAAGTRLAILEATVLLEAEWDDLCDEIWLVTGDKDLALRRLMERNKLTYDEALLRYNAQMGRLAKQDERIAQLRADGKRIVAIHNDDNMDRFRVIIGELVQQALAAQPTGP